MIQKGKCFVIAEIASAHNGNINEIKQLIKSSYESKADAVNFQIFNKDELLVRDHEKYGNFTKIEFSRPQWKEILDYASEFKDIKTIITPFDSESLRLFYDYADAFKLPSSDMENPFFIKQMAEYRKPVFVAAGGSSYEEIKYTLDHLRNKCETVLMHGFQAFPTKLEDTNIRLIGTLKKAFDVDVGFLDHISGYDELAVTLPAVAFGYGACAVEKHITLSRSKKGFDWHSSLEPHEFRRMVDLIRKTEVAMGSGISKMSLDEITYKKKMEKNIVARHNISCGDVIRLEDLAFKRSTHGLSPMKSLDLIGSVPNKDIQRDEVIRTDYLENKVLICLAVRLKSDRLPRKAFAQIQDQTAIEHQIDRLKSTGLPIVLCTSINEQDRPLIDVAQKKDIKYLMGHELNVMQRFIDAAKMEKATIVVRTTGDRPLISPEYLLRLVNHHIKTKAEYTYVQGLPAGIPSEVMSLSALEKANKLAQDPNNSEYMTLYFRRPEVFKVEKIVADEAHKRDYRITLDTPQDLELIKSIYSSLYKPGNIISLEDIISFLDSNKELAYINKDVKEADISNINLKLKTDKN